MRRPDRESMRTHDTLHEASKGSNRFRQMQQECAAQRVLISESCQQGRFVAAEPERTNKRQLGMPPAAGTGPTPSSRDLRGTLSSPVRSSRRRIHVTDCELCYCPGTL